MCQLVHIVFHILFAFELLSHAFEHLSELDNFFGAFGWRCCFFPGNNGGGEAAEGVEGAGEPEGDAQPDGQGQSQQQQSIIEHAFFSALNGGGQGAVGVGHSQHADDLVAIHNGCCNMHDGAVGVTRNGSGGACAISPLQRAPHVIPLRVVFAELFVF